MGSAAVFLLSTDSSKCHSLVFLCISSGSYAAGIPPLAQQRAQQWPNLRSSQLAADRPTVSLSLSVDQLSLSLSRWLECQCQQQTAVLLAHGRWLCTCPLHSDSTHCSRIHRQPVARLPSQTLAPNWHPTKLQCDRRLPHQTHGRHRQRAQNRAMPVTDTAPHKGRLHHVGKQWYCNALIRVSRSPFQTPVSVWLNGHTRRNGPNKKRNGTQRNETILKFYLRKMVIYRTSCMGDFVSGETGHRSGVR